MNPPTVCYITFMHREANIHRLRELALCVAFASRHYKVAIRSNLKEELTAIGLGSMVWESPWEDLQPWSLHKIKTHGMVAVMHEARKMVNCDPLTYLHIDSDVFLIKPLPDRLWEKGFIAAQSPEGLEHYPGVTKAHQPWRDMVVADPFIAYNCGIVGGDMDEILPYVVLARAAAKDSRFKLLPTWAEQVPLGKFKVHTLFDHGDFASEDFVHLMRTKDYPSVLAKVERRLVEESPKMASRLGCSITLPRRKTVSFLTPCWNVGGAEQWIATMCKWLDPDRFDVQAVHVAHPAAVERDAKNWLPRSVDLRFDAPQENQTDILITWGFMDLRERLRGWKGQVVDVQHSAYPSVDWQLPVAAEAALAHHQQGIHLAAVSEVCLTNFPEEIRKMVTVIENGVDPARVAATRPRWEVRREIGLDESHKIALFVGRIHNEQKNPQLLIDAVDLLGHEWRAVLLGPIFDRPKFSSKSIHLCPDWNVANILNAADMLVHPARHESHGLAINEAWLARRPVVSCAYPVNRLFHSKHGEMMKLVPVDATPQQLADAMEQVVSMRYETWDTLSRAHRVASRSYTAHKMGCAWSDFLAGLF